MTKKKFTKAEAKSKLWIVYWIIILFVLFIAGILFANNYCDSSALVEQLGGVCSGG